MPFQSDDQRKAAFARMHGHGSGGSTPKPPKPPKPPKYKPPKPPKNWQVGYGGNYTEGLPSWSNWYTSLPNTTGAPLAPAGSGMGGYGTIPAGSFDLVWDDYQGTGARPLTTAEKILLGIPVAAVVAWAAPAIGGLTAAGVAEYTLGATSGAATAFITTAGTQGGALGYSALALSGIPMSINDAPNYIRTPGSNRVRTQYVDLVSYVGGLKRNQKYIDFKVTKNGIDWTIR